MTITSLDRTACEQQEPIRAATDERIPLMALPKLAWVGGALFVANLVIGFGMLVTPNLETDPYGREVRAYDSASSKPSPFTEVVDTQKHKVKLAAKATPVTFVPTPAADELYAAATLDIPRSTTRSTQLDLPRASRAYQQLDMPVRTEAAVYRPDARPSNSVKVYNGGASYDMPRATYTPSSSDATPRRASERDKKFVVIN